jgi:hypothetical protein
MRLSGTINKSVAVHLAHGKDSTCKANRPGPSSAPALIELCLPRISHRQLESHTSEKILTRVSLLESLSLSVARSLSLSYHLLQEGVLRCSEGRDLTEVGSG